MIIKRITVLLLLSLALINAVQAQKLTVERMALAEEDQAAVTEKRTDAGGTPCALVKVKLDMEGASFGGNVISPVDYRDGEYWVYMTDGSCLTGSRQRRRFGL